MTPSRKGPRRAGTAALAAAALVVTGCGASDAPFEQHAQHPEAGAAAGSTEIPHHEDNGLRVSGELPQGDQHPPDLTTQQMHELGSRSVFAIQGRRPDDFVASGTGFLVDKEGGMALTTAHVVEGLTAISGRFNSGQRGSLHVIASDPCTDLAVVHFATALPEDAEDLVIGSSGAVKPGDPVTVLGYPELRAEDPSEQRLLISSGLVNATKVTAKPPGLPHYKDTIQHGASVAPGSSGGPLLDHHGRVVGINTRADAGSSAGSEQGQSYSIGVDSAKPEIVDKLLKGQSQNDLGWSAEEYHPGYFEALDPEDGAALDARARRAGVEDGLYVKSVTPGSGASKAGIKPGMLITKLQNTSTATVAEMCDIAESILPGAVAAVEGLYLNADPARFDTTFYLEFTLPGKH